jgi:hypothetical protein
LPKPKNILTNCAKTKTITKAQIKHKAQEHKQNPKAKKQKTNKAKKPKIAKPKQLCKSLKPTHKILADCQKGKKNF